jgi:hypothetical protein
MRPTILAFGFLFVSQLAGAATLHVPANYATIGAAITAANPGDVVLVAAGTYHERISLGATKDGVKIDSESGAAATIIDGGYTGTVVTMNGVGSGSEIVGFTITHGGFSPPNSSNNGGGILAIGSPHIENNVITGNSANFGGGISVRGGASIVNNTVDGNLAVASPVFAGGGAAFTWRPQPKRRSRAIRSATTVDPPREFWWSRQPLTSRTM